jgi:hypothetical protein
LLLLLLLLLVVVLLLLRCVPPQLRVHLRLLPAAAIPGGACPAALAVGYSCCV